MKATYDKESALYVLIGATFGQTYALNYIQPLLWIHTPAYKKVARMLIVIIPILLFYYVYQKYLTSDRASILYYLLNFSVVNLVESFFIFGLYPILCKKLHLIVTEDEFKRKNPEFYDVTPQLARRRTKD